MLTRSVQAFREVTQGAGPPLDDQAYLRYLRDVRPWRPQVVILGLIDHDLRRSMAV